MADRKIAFLVRKLARELGIKDFNEKNIETIFKNLLFQNAEYRKKNSSQIRQCVSDELYDFITSVSINVVIDNASRLALKFHCDDSPRETPRPELLHP
jgi:hypothetical protein